MPLSKSENIIHSLYHITSQYEKGFEFQVEQLLKLGCERFNLEIGILSSIVEDDFTLIQQISPPEVGLKVGMVFDVNRTYCALTLDTHNAIAEAHFQHSKYKCHPAYNDFGLEAYIGAPVTVDGALFGTFSFSSRTPLDEPFTQVDLDAIQLMASWIGTELSRREKELMLQELNDKLLKLSTTDGLTQIKNRMFFQEELERQISFANRSCTPLSVLILDIDYFKNYNDDLGHLEGDNALIQTAQIMMENSRDYDIVSRFGGEEFAIILPNTTSTGALQYGEKLCSAFEKYPWQFKKITVSIGIETLIGDNTETDIKAISIKLINQADKALYYSKDNGRNQANHFKDIATFSIN